MDVSWKWWRTLSLTVYPLLRGPRTELWDRATTPVMSQLKDWPGFTVRKEISLWSVKLTTTSTCSYYFVTCLHLENCFDKQISRLHSVTFKVAKECKQTEFNKSMHLLEELDNIPSFHLIMILLFFLSLSLLICRLLSNLLCCSPQYLFILYRLLVNPAQSFISVVVELFLNLY